MKSSLKGFLWNVLLFMWTEPLTAKESRYVKHTREDKSQEGVNRKQREEGGSLILSSARFLVVENTGYHLLLYKSFSLWVTF